MRSAEPKNIDVSLSTGVTIDWADRHHSHFTLQYLRDRCPCATCTTARQQSHGSADPAMPFQMFKKTLKMEGVEPVGRYALQFKWNDGHSSGIYSFELLREICPCDECRSAKS